jgi:hypothetical protein
MYGLLAYYVRREWLKAMEQSGVVGRINTACWLSPSAHSACMVPYSLGLRSPRDVCLLVDVSSIVELWGPGTCPVADNYPNIWRGGGIEFYCPAGSPIDFRLVRATLDLSPCGDVF